MDKYYSRLFDKRSEQLPEALPQLHPLPSKIQNKFFENPEKVAELVYGVSDELQKLGVNIVKEVLENADECFRRSLASYARQHKI